MKTCLLTDDIAVKIAEQIVISYRAKQEQDIRRNKWYAFAKANDQHEDDFVSLMKSLWGRQEKEVLSNMKKTPKAFIKENPAIVDSWLFGKRIWEEKFKNESMPLIKGMVSANGNRILADLPVTGISFSMINPRVQVFMRNKTIKFSKEVNETTNKKLAKTLSEGLEKGETITKLKNRVKDTFSRWQDEKIDNNRAKMIARTETTSAANFGTQEAYKQSKVVEKKEWLATLDMRVRDSHAMMDGEVVELDELFSNGLEYPGDSSGAPAEVCNCRCTTLPVIEGKD